MALRPCRECEQQISTDAKVCPHCGKRVGMSKSSGCLLIFVLLIVGLIILLKISDSGSDSGNYRPPTATSSDDASLLLSRCGTPDVDDSTAYDNPRPPIPTRWLEYRTAHIKVMFIANSEMGAPPPYRWKTVGALDPRTKKALSPEEVFRRLPCWRSK
jgi:hypothetical protein